MPTELIIALISFGGTALGTFGGIFINTRLSNYRIEQLENKVDKHNTIIERTYKLEQHGAILDEEIKVINHRINDLEDINKG